MLDIISRFLRKPAPCRAPTYVRQPRVVFLTGAGLSQESGIPTYRDETGRYVAPDIEKTMSAAAFKADPEAIHAVCDERRAMLADAEPNEAHRMIARLAQRYGERLFHITKNVDGLVERAGFAGSLNVHGSLTSMRSIGDETNTVDIGFTRYWGGDADQAPERGFRFRCERTNTLFRPDVVLYQEQTRKYHKMYLVMGALHPDDLLVVIGSSGATIPVNRWVANADCRKIIVDPHATPAIDRSSFHEDLRLRAAEAATEIEAKVVGHLG